VDDYRVSLDVFNGPLDLLLYLIRRDEIDIHDIPIARITEQYCAHVETLRALDPDLAGEFLVMAATLMEIKSRMLLPRQEEVEDVEEAFDPRGELVRQLLEYKAFKDAADDLRQAGAAQSMRFPRRPGPAPEADEGRDLEDVQLWDLVEAFGRLMSAIGADRDTERIIQDDTPVELHAEDVLDRLGREGNMTFREVFAGRTSRSELVGLFLAVLELVRRRRVFVEQESGFGEIYLYLNPAPPERAEPAGGEDAEDSVRPGLGAYLAESGEPPPAWRQPEAGSADAAGPESPSPAPKEARDDSERETE
jgi:segregation and condensation protein A